MSTQNDSNVIDYVYCLTFFSEHKISTRFDQKVSCLCAIESVKEFDINHGFEIGGHAEEVQRVYRLRLRLEGVQS